MWNVIVVGKHGLREESSFDFKYVPDLHKTTHAEDREMTGLQQAGIERRNLQTLLLGCGALSVAAVMGVRVASGLAGYFVRLL